MNVLVSLPGCAVEKVRSGDGKLVLEAHKRSKYECCPDCGRRSGSVHSSYSRHPDDLPLSEQRLELCLCVRRFRCLNLKCKRCTFAEPFPDLVLRYAQRTCRLRSVQSSVGLAVGGEGGSALLEVLHMSTSPDSLLRIIRAMTLPEMVTPKVLGVDDWSFKKARQFGTILVDLEKHQVVDLLPERSAEVLTAWLKEHPGIEVISRDRSTEYAAAATEGAPTAVQVADRWHLLKNLGDVVKQWLERYRATLTQVAQSLAAALPREKVVLVTPKAQDCQTTYKQALQLKAEGFKIPTIARKLNMPHQTLYRWMHKGCPTFGKPTRTRLADFAPYIRQRYAEGMTNKLQLYREIVTQGFQGSYANIYVFCNALEAGLGQDSTRLAKDPTDSKNPKGIPSLTAPVFSMLDKQIILSTPNDKLDTEQKQWLELVLASIPQAVQVRGLVQGFKALLHGEVTTPLSQLQTWLRQAEDSGVQELKRFANGLCQDLKAIEAAVTLPWSNGQVEGQVNKLKLIKRSMFGRAKFDLLRKRVLLASLHGTCG